MAEEDPRIEIDSFNNVTAYWPDGTVQGFQSLDLAKAEAQQRGDEDLEVRTV